MNAKRYWNTLKYKWVDCPFKCPFDDSERICDIIQLDNNSVMYWSFARNRYASRQLAHAHEKDLIIALAALGLEDRGKCFKVEDAPPVLKTESSTGIIANQAKRLRGEEEEEEEYDE